ncbi:MAG: two-component system, OmpR family, sensor kinase [Solirubrobacteraceae bacterium]|jgi:two-component system OmpR family sensor kinase|nr:two-component system, OmpR family, sensor kinase [Solirubrobacteraceae bacterium]MEA2395110.1 two-component system, OmpR family, sensor kinase [Solirubrobacteraceae bacterium]
MASLRSRLVAGLVAVAAVGLVALAGITYFEQRSFLLDRVDQQARSAVGFVRGALGHQAFGGDRFGDGAGPGPDHGPGGAGLPLDTYGELRDAGGKVLAQKFIFTPSGQTPPARPQLPERLPIGQEITVPAKAGGGVRYRVLADRSSDEPGITTVVAVPMREVDQTLSRLLLVEALVIGAILAALGVLSWFVVRLGLRPLDRIGRTADAIAGGDLSHRVQPATPRTEVGRLGLALNAMLDRLEEAFASREASESRLRQFIADASHELRTPLQSIRGYAELFRIGAAREPVETTKAMQRIEDEATRMGVLVEDLLWLARMDEVRDPVRTRVDLAALATDAVADARATAPEREIAVHVEAPAVVLGDSDLLHQVLANLLRNALVHTPAGTPIEVTVSRRADEAWLEVRDHGPGLPTSDTDALFERFWRAEGGRERGKAGAGLGLAIVAGIVGAHDGRVQAANAAGGGARFLVCLPAAA